jgi:hypothetical protein
VLQSRHQPALAHERQRPGDEREREDRGGWAEYRAGSGASGQVLDASQEPCLRRREAQRGE